MNDLAKYAAYAEVFGGLAILLGAAFAIVQIIEVKKRRRYHVAADLCRGFANPELANAVTLLRALPDDIGLKELKSYGSEVEEAAQLVGMTFETMGLLVHRKIASFEIVQELTGGLLLMMWRKIGGWIRETRQEQSNPRFGEWVHWLAERVEAEESHMTPAFEAYAQWKKGARFDQIRLQRQSHSSSF